MSRVHRHAPPAPAHHQRAAASPARVRAPQVDLAAGDQGAQVERLQRALVKLGLLSSADFNTGPGIYGPRTAHAVSLLQERNGIAGDGGAHYGPRTRAALEQALGQPQPGPVVVKPPKAPGPTALVAVPQYGQMDPRWGGDAYIFGGSTVGAVGCSLTSLAMVARYATGDARWTPGYVNAGHYGDALGTLRMVNLGARIGSPLPNLYDQGAGFIGGGSGAQARLLDAVRSELRAGHPVVLGMGLNGANGHIENGWTRHTVVAVGVAANGDVILNDPATGGRTLLSSYLARPQFTGFDRAVAVVN